MSRRSIGSLAIAALLLAGCGGSTETVTVTETETETVVETVDAQPAGLPEAVAETRDELLEAAESDDYDELRPLVPEGLSYTFGGPFEGGAIAYWQRVEQQTGVRPIELLAGLLRLPYTLYQGIYVWPFAFDKAPDELTDYERGLLRSVAGQDLSDDFGGGTGYLGWRVGIEPDGDWIFFIAGD